MIREHCFQIGIITKPHGIDGSVIVRLNSAFADEIEPGESLFVETDGTMIPFFIEEIRPLGDIAYIKFEFVDTDSEAGKLRGKQLFADRDSFGVETFDMSAASLFTGYRIVDENSDFSAIIDDYVDNPANPLFLARQGNREVFIPVHENFIVRINRRKKIIHMKLPGGLTEL